MVACKAEERRVESKLDIYSNNIQTAKPIYLEPVRRSFKREL
jgi:hypothetical protein